MTRPEPQELIPALIVALTDGSASVEVLSNNNLTIFEVTLPEAGKGKLIGKNGSLVSAIRRILVGFSGRDDHSYRIEIL